MENTKTEHHGRELLLSGIGLVAEFLAARYGISLLAWAGAAFLFLAVVNYTRHYLTSPRWRYAFPIAAGVALILGTLFVTGVRLWPKRVPPMPTQLAENRAQTIAPSHASGQAPATTPPVLAPKKRQTKKVNRTVTSAVPTPNQSSSSEAPSAVTEIHRPTESLNVEAQHHEPEDKVAAQVNQPPTQASQQAQPTYSVTNPSGSIVNQASPNYGTQTVNNINADRRFTEETAEVTAVKLLAFKATPLFISCIPGDAEQQQLARQLQMVLDRGAHWNASLGIASWITNRSISGIEVQAPAAYLDAAKELAKSLTDLGMTAYVAPRQQDSLPQDSIHVVLGAKR